MLDDSASKLLTPATPVTYGEQLKRDKAMVEAELSFALTCLSGDKTERYAAAQKWLRVAFRCIPSGKMFAWASTLRELVEADFNPGRSRPSFCSDTKVVDQEAIARRVLERVGKQNLAARRAMEQQPQQGVPQVHDADCAARQLAHSGWYTCTSGACSLPGCSRPLQFTRSVSLCRAGGCRSCTTNALGGRQGMSAALGRRHLMLSSRCPVLTTSFWTSIAWRL
jgi:hypothetical protein